MRSSNRVPTVRDAAIFLLIAFHRLESELHGSIFRQSMLLLRNQFRNSRRGKLVTLTRFMELSRSDCRKELIWKEHRISLRDDASLGARITISSSISDGCALILDERIPAAGRILHRGLPKVAVDLSLSPR